MVTLSLYKNLSDRRVLKKNIILVATFTNVLFLDDTSVLSPSFDLVLDSTQFSEINYCYCADTKRYYYINDIIQSSGGRVILNCAVDVLMTYSAQILNTTALIYTQTINKNVLLSNSFIPSQSNEQIINLKFTDSEFNISGISNNFVLTTYKGDKNGI